jgi:putative spermidine/putrescine transport system substrate-binding protein
MLVLGVLITGAACSSNDSNAVDSGSGTTPSTELDPSDWDSVVEHARGTTVNFYAYGKDEKINKWIDVELGGYLKENYDITLNRVPTDDTQVIVAKMLDEKQANLDPGSVDVLWVNGENFSTAKENDLLYGPFTQDLPNFKEYVDSTIEGYNYDFGTSVDGLEVPAGNAQFVLINDAAKTSETPKNYEELLEFVKKYPGQVTYAAPPDFTGSVFVRQIIYDVVGYDALLAAGTDKEKIREAIRPALDYLEELKPYLWREGTTYPSAYSQVDNMFFDGELVLDMSYDPNIVAGWIEEGQIPDTARAFIFEKGTIGNTSFFAIPKNAPNLAAALVVNNAILSPQLQASKSDPAKWGNLPVIDFTKLSPDDRALFDAIPSAKGVPPLSELTPHMQPEIAAGVVPLIEEIWIEEIPG